MSYLLQAFEALQRLVVVAPARIIAVTDNTDDRAGSDARENGLGRLEGASGDERRQIADDYLAGVFHDVPPELQARMRRRLPDLAENPDREQMNDWLSMARSFRSPDFRELARKLAPVFDSEAELLRERAEVLVAHRSISITRNAGVVRATFRAPGRWRPGVVHAWAERADGSVSSHSLIPLPSTLDSASVLSEVTLQLAIALAQVED